MGFVDLGLGQGATDLVRDCDHPNLAALHCHSPKCAPLVALFLVDLVADRRVSRLPATAGHRSPVSQVRTLAAEEPRADRQSRANGAARRARHSPRTNVLDGCRQKTTGLNAYVTGIGASKRIVVWDTIIAKMNNQQIVFVAGHEMGHYVLKHIPKGLAFLSILLLIAFYLGCRCLGWLLARWGSAWER